MHDIAEAVGLVKGSLYHYIRSKEQLLARLFEGSLGDAIVELAERAVAIVTGKRQTPPRASVGDRSSPRD